MAFVKNPTHNIGTMSFQSSTEKRHLDDAEHAMIITKKRKVVVAPNQKVDPSELASAFALASLASLSPGGTFETRDAKSKYHKDKEVRKAPSFEESRSPKGEETSVLPERRASVSSERAGVPESPNSESAPSTPQNSAIVLDRKVHFAPHTKLSFPPTSTPGMEQNKTPMSRRLIVPSKIQRVPKTIPGSYAHLHPTSPNLHRPQFYPNQHHVYQQHPWYHGRMYPPQSLLQPPLLHPENPWICDFCNVASFATYEDACLHEKNCDHNPSNCDSMVVKASSLPSKTYYKGCMSLAIQDSDCEWLSELNCFIRSNCVEAFSATDDDVSRSSKRGRIALNQVGIRCRFCTDCPTKEKAVGAVSFPTSVAGIYESVKRWQRVHLELCESVPQDVRLKLAALANTNVWVPTTRQYWSDSAKALGLVDTTDGIRFGKSLAGLSINPQSDTNTTVTKQAIGIEKMDTSEIAVTPHQHIDDRLVFPDDKEMIPPYVHFLMTQVEKCHFTEADRFVARSKGPVGYPGFQCRHCNGHAGLGKYFPSSSKSLSTNSTSQNIHAHLLKCRKCPEHVKDELLQLKIEKSRAPRLEPGWRKVFFDKIWERLHGSV